MHKIFEANHNSIKKVFLKNQAAIESTMKNKDNKALRDLVEEITQDLRTDPEQNDYINKMLYNMDHQNYDKNLKYIWEIILASTDKVIGRRRESAIRESFNDSFMNMKNSYYKLYQDVCDKLGGQGWINEEILNHLDIPADKVENAIYDIAQEHGVIFNYEDFIDKYSESNESSENLLEEGQMKNIYMDLAEFVDAYCVQYDHHLSEDKKKWLVQKMYDYIADSASSEKEFNLMINDPEQLDIVIRKYLEAENLEESRLEESAPIKGKDPEAEDVIARKLGLAFYDGKIKAADMFNVPRGSKANYILYLSDDNEYTARKWEEKLMNLGAKYLQHLKRIIRFFLSDDIVNPWIEEEKKKIDDEYQKKLDVYNAEMAKVDIDQYKPSQKILDKIKDYRDRGSKVNVKAITDRNKLFTYYYAASILGWNDLIRNIEDVISWGDEEEEQILEAINARVSKDDSLKDTRTDFEKNRDLPNTNGLFTFDDPKLGCWLPNKILKFFIENKIPVHFEKRTSGSHYDHNGAQWTEIEHFTVFPDDPEKSKRFSLAVHTDEGGRQPDRYTLEGWTSTRSSASDVIEALKRRLLG